MHVATHGAIEKAILRTCVVLENVFWGGPGHHLGMATSMASKYTLWSGHKKINAEIPVYSLTSLIFIAALFDHITLWWVYGNIVRHRGRLGSWSVSNTISGCIFNTQSDALVHVIRFLNLILCDPVGIPF